MGKWGNDVRNVVGCADRTVFACACGGDCVAAGCVVQIPTAWLEGVSGSGAGWVWYGVVLYVFAAHIYGVGNGFAIAFF